MAADSSVSLPRVGLAVGAAADSFDTGTGVGSVVGEATGTAVSGTVVGSGLVELGVGAIGVALPSVEEAARGRSRRDEDVGGRIKELMRATRCTAIMDGAGFGPSCGYSNYAITKYSLSSWCLRLIDNTLKHRLCLDFSQHFHAASLLYIFF